MLQRVGSGALLLRSLRIASCVSNPARSRLLQTLPQRQSLASSFRSFASFTPLRQQAVAQADTQDVQEFTRFEELADHGIIDRRVINTLVNKMNIHTMTDVQRMTINECLHGDDVIAQAKTGTGKTLAFLMPIVQRILRDPSLATNRSSRASIDDIRAVIISPTRELAEQIAVEASKIVAGTAIKVQTAVGGTGKRYHLEKMMRDGCHILVGTPGRIKDIISDSSNRISLGKVETFVLDEADRLLDIGFAPEIKEIASYMPKSDARQTLMFSATVPKEVVSLVRQTLRPDFKFVRTVDPNEAPTHEKVPQKVVFMRGLQNQLPAIMEIAHNAIEAHKNDPTNNMPFKAIVYFGSTNEVNLAYETFSLMRDPSTKGSGGMFSKNPIDPCIIVQMSSRLEQRQRTSNAERFRRAESAILFSSDVTARGMDFPNVSHVIQIGLPRNTDDYVHRIGRTGRAGKSGEGWLLLNEDERNQFRHKLGSTHIKIDEATDIVTAGLDMTKGAQLPAHIARLLGCIETGVKAVPFKTKAETYRSLLGVLSSQNSNRSKQTVIDLMNELSRFGWGLVKPPSLSADLVNKLGFGRCEGIEITSKEEGFGNQFGSRQTNARFKAKNDFDARDPFGMGSTEGRGTFRGRDEGQGSFGNREAGQGSFGNREGGRGGFGDRNGGRSSFGNREGGRGGFGGRSGGRGGFGNRDGGRGGFEDRGRSNDRQSH